MKARIIPEIRWQLMPLNATTNIIETAKKGYGCKFISRETGEELDDNAVIGLFASTIKDAMDEFDV